MHMRLETTVNFGRFTRSRSFRLVTIVLGIILAISQYALYSRHIVLKLHSIGAKIASRRKALGFSQSALADKAGVSRATLEALENGRSGELGFSKVANILATLGLELKLQEANLQRPTLDQLLEEDRDDKGLDRRR
jgi:DNA-binding XRE family transcriptional regulator